MESPRAGCLPCGPGSWPERRLPEGCGIPSSAAGQWGGPSVRVWPDLPSCHSWSSGQARPCHQGALRSCPESLLAASSRLPSGQPGLLPGPCCSPWTQGTRNSAGAVQRIPGRQVLSTPALSRVPFLTSGPLGKHSAPAFEFLRQRNGFRTRPRMLTPTTGTAKPALVSPGQVRAWEHLPPAPTLKNDLFLFV